LKSADTSFKSYARNQEMFFSEHNVAEQILISSI